MTNQTEQREWNPDTDCWYHDCPDTSGQVHTCSDGRQRTTDGELVPSRDDVVAWLADIVETHCQDTPYAKLALTLIGNAR